MDTHSNVRAARAPVGLAAATLSIVLSTMAAHAGELDPHAAHAHGSLGAVQFPISCSTAAQQQFNHALALLHHMTYPQARTAFAQVARTDPRCAMAHWGIAMTLFQPLWPTRPTAAALRRGWAEVQQAKTLSPPSERERLYIAAAEAFFLEPEVNDYWRRVARWEAAQEKIYRAFPADSEAAVFYALAHLATTPANSASREHADRAAGILLRVYQRNPEHPGAMHYLVHANDVPGREHELLEITRKYEQIAPDNPHALHMPTHIYTRLGDWDAVIRGNLRAADAALAHPAGERGELVWDEFPHAIEYLVYAQLQQGADTSAAAQIRRLQSTPHLEPTFKTAFHLASTQARYALERHAWTEAMRIRPREPAYLEWDRFAWPEAVAQFAHGFGAAHLGEIEAATTASARLDALATATRDSGEDLFARNIRVLHQELDAWLTYARGDRDAAARQMHAAAQLEATTPKPPVTPAPTLPANELLGDLLLDMGRAAPALAAYKEALRQYPNRFNSVLGAARAAVALGDRPTAQSFYAALLQLGEHGTRTAELQEANRFVSRSREGRN